MLLVAVSVVESVCGVLFPHLSGVRVDGVEARGATIWFDARTDTGTATCPRCGTASERVHSRYVRYLSDCSVGGRAVRIRLQVRRFRCLDRQCAQVIFAEQLGELAGWYQRRSNMLTTLLTKVGLALGGRGGHRMTRHLATEVSRSTLLRLVRAIPLPQVGALPAVGIDDFAIRRGRIYGTIIVDMATRQPVDLLEDPHLRHSRRLAARASGGPGRLPRPRRPLRRWRQPRCTRCDPGRRSVAFVAQPHHCGRSSRSCAS